MRTRGYWLLPHRPRKQYKRKMPNVENHRSARYRIDRFPNKKVTYPGVDRGGFGAIIAENDHIVVIKWPGGKHWVGRGIPRAQHPPSTDVLRKDEDGRATLLISWQNDRKKRVPQP